MSSLRNFIRQKYEIYATITTRTMALFIIDWWFLEAGSSKLSSNFFRSNSSNYFTSFVTNLILLNALLLLILPIRIVRALYSHIACGSLLLIARFLSHYYVSHSSDEYLNLSHIFKLSKFKEFNSAYNETSAESEISAREIIFAFGDTLIAKLVSFLVVHVLIVAIVNCLLEGASKFYFYKNCIACYMLPVVARYFEVSPYYLEIIQNTSSVLILLSLIQYFYHRLPNLFKQIKSYYAQLIGQAESNGILPFANTLNTLNTLNTCFFIFWILTFLFKLYQHNQFHRKPDTDLWLNLLIVISNVCCSPISLISTVVTVTYISYAILFAVKVYLHGFSSKRSPAAIVADREESNVDQNADRIENQNDAQRQTIYNQSHTGWEEGLTTLLLALITSLTELKPAARAAVLTIIFFAVLSSLLQSMLEIAEPVVLSLSTHHGKNAMLHHIRILLFLSVLFTAPIYTTYLLAQVFPVDFWLCIVVSTCTLTSAKVFDLLIIDCLLLYDSTRDEPWEMLDEVVYLIRAIVKIIEFVIAVSVVLAGIYEASFNRFSWISISILMVHCYFNVLQRLQAGFRSFIKRRRAVCKSNSLPNATKEQIEKFNDICSICHAELRARSNETSIVITKCSHLFHRACLRKALFFRDFHNCPMCNT